MRDRAGNMSVSTQMQIIKKADKGSGMPKNTFVKIGTTSASKL
jgi:hypothetical protein